MRSNTIQVLLILLIAMVMAAMSASAKQINVHGEFNKELMEKFITTIPKMQPGSELTIDINSPGGSLFVLEEILKIIKEYNLRTTCIVDEYAASAGAFLLLSCDTQKVKDNALIIFHLPYFEVNGMQMRIYESSLNAYNKFNKNKVLDTVLGDQLKDFLIGGDVYILGYMYNKRLGNINRG